MPDSLLRPFAEVGLAAARAGGGDVLIATRLRLAAIEAATAEAAATARS
jgi:hypothetical protein